MAPPATEVAVERDVLVPMRDGVRLATDIYRPVARDGSPAGESLPTLLYRTPYDKTEVEQAPGWASRFAQHGYAAVVQDCRGCFGSEGEVDFVFPEADDGYDTVAWVVDQPWCDGRVGTWGTSWSGWTQTALAAAGAQGVAAMVPNMSGSNGHASTVRHAGAMELRFIAWAFWHSAYNTQVDLKAHPWVDPALNLGSTSFGEWLQRWPIRPGVTQLALVPAYERWAFELLTHADYDEYWAHPAIHPLAHLDRFTDAPTLLVGGWYDSYTRATFELFTALSRDKRGPIRVLVGPWTHGQSTVEEAFAGDVWFGHEAALPSFWDLHLRWFDRWIRDLPAAEPDDPPVRIFVMGGGPGTRGPGGRLHHGGCWRDEQEWPLARTRCAPWYLHGDGGLRPDPPTADEDATTFRFDPSNPVPSIGGSVSSLAEIGPLPRGLADPRFATRNERMSDIMRAGGFDQHEAEGFFGCRPPYLPLAARPDVLVFQTDPLTEDLEVTGPIEVKLWVASTAVDTDITAKLIDVYPPSPAYPYGYALNLTDSIVRLRYRDDPRSAALLDPGDVVEVTVELYPTSNLFVAGHRLRLDVSSSNFPRFDVNPNTGEPLGQERRRVAADNTVLHGATHPSHIVLPIIPPS
ncbi:MAG TPA: CocE/NonD family hydrolase [Nitriliruptorales bacterium]